MAYAAAGFKMIDNAFGANGLFTYTSADALATVIASGYFNTEVLKLQKNDMILCALVNNGTNVFSLIGVGSNDGTTVTTKVAVFA